MFDSMFDGPEEAFNYLEEYANTSGVSSTCSIDDDWEVSQKPIEFKPDFREPIEIEIDNLAPFWGDNAAEEMKKYIRYINQQAKKGYPLQSYHEYDEDHRMFGHYSNARIIKEKVWVTFTPKKTGDYWISYSKMTFV